MARPNKQFCRAMEEILMQQKQLHEGFLHSATDVGTNYVEIKIKEDFRLILFISYSQVYFLVDD